MSNWITADTDFGKVTWMHHPLFDEPRITNVLPPYQIAKGTEPVEVIIHEGFYWELVKRVLNKKLTLVDSHDLKYQILALQHHDDFFEPIYTALIMRCSNDYITQPITDLRESFMSSTGYMLQMMNDIGMLILDSTPMNNGQGILPMITPP